MMSPGHVPVMDPETPISVWVERAHGYAVEAVANAERAHQRTVEQRLDRPSRGWTAGELRRSYRGSADGERRYLEEADALTLHGYRGWLETSDAGDPLGARILVALHLRGPAGPGGSSHPRIVTWTKARTT